MAEDRYYRPRNWGKFQSRSNNSKVWVKVNVSLLDDPDYLALTDAQRLLWHDLLLLFGRTGRPQPYDSGETARVLRLNSQVTARGLPALLSNGFIELCDRTQNLWEKFDQSRPALEEKRKNRDSSSIESSVAARARNNPAAADSGNGPDPPKPNGEDKPLEVQARELIQTFDACQEHVWGDQRRQIPHGKDLATCMEWVKSGIVQNDVAEVALPIFQRLMKQGQDPPCACRYLAKPIKQRIAQRNGEDAR